MKVTNGVLGYGSAGPNGIFLKLVRASILCPAAGRPATCVPHASHPRARRASASCGGRRGRGAWTARQGTTSRSCRASSSWRSRRHGRSTRRPTRRASRSRRSPRTHATATGCGATSPRAAPRRGRRCAQCRTNGSLGSKRSPHRTTWPTCFNAGGGRPTGAGYVVRATCVARALYDRLLECELVGDCGQRPRGARPQARLPRWPAPPQCYEPASPPLTSPPALRLQDGGEEARLTAIAPPTSTIAFERDLGRGELALAYWNVTGATWDGRFSLSMPVGESAKVWALRIRSACRSASTPQSPPQVWVVHTLSVPSARGGVTSASTRSSSTRAARSGSRRAPTSSSASTPSRRHAGRTSSSSRRYLAKPSERLAAAAASLGGGRLNGVPDEAGTGKSGGDKGGVASTTTQFM